MPQLDVEVVGDGDGEGVFVVGSGVGVFVVGSGEGDGGFERVGRGAVDGVVVEDGERPERRCVAGGVVGGVAGGVIGGVVGEVVRSRPCVDGGVVEREETDGEREVVPAALAVGDGFDGVAVAAGGGRFGPVWVWDGFEGRRGSPGALGADAVGGEREVRADAPVERGKQPPNALGFEPVGGGPWRERVACEDALAVVARDGEPGVAVAGVERRGVAVRARTVDAGGTERGLAGVRAGGECGGGLPAGVPEPVAVGGLRDERADEFVEVVRELRGDVDAGLLAEHGERRRIGRVGVGVRVKECVEDGGAVLVADERERVRARACPSVRARSRFRVRLVPGVRFGVVDHTASGRASAKPVPINESTKTRGRLRLTGSPSSILSMRRPPSPAGSLAARLPGPLVAKYYAYRATATFGFFWPIFTVFLLSRDLNYTQIALLGSLSAGVGVLGELPTGYVGDRVGRRNSLLLGAVARAASVYGLAVVHSFPGFVAVYAVWAVGGAFTSGAGDAWLYDVLAQRLDESRYTRVRGRGGAVNMTVSAVTMLGAGALYAVDPTLPFWVGGTVNAAGIPVLLSMPRVERGASSGDDSTGGDNSTGDDRLGVREAAGVVREQLLTPPVRSVVVGVALFFGVVGAADTYVQPIAVNGVGLSETALGPFYTGFSLVAAVASYNADRIEGVLGRTTALALVPLVVGVVLVAPALLVPVVAMPAFVVMKAGREVVAPVASGYLNDHVDSLGRATVLSAAAMCYGTVRFVLKPLGGVVADALGPLAAVAGLGGLLVATVLVGRGVAALSHADDADPASA